MGYVELVAGTCADGRPMCAAHLADHAEGVKRLEALGASWAMAREKAFIEAFFVAPDEPEADAPTIVEGKS